MNRQQACVDNDGTPLYRAQGEVKALQSLQKAFIEAPGVLEKFRNNQPAGK